MTQKKNQDSKKNYYKNHLPYIFSWFVGHFPRKQGKLNARMKFLVKKSTVYATPQNWEWERNCSSFNFCPLKAGGPMTELFPPLVEFHFLFFFLLPYHPLSTPSRFAYIINFVLSLLVLLKVHTTHPVHLIHHQFVCTSLQ